MRLLLLPMWQCAFERPLAGALADVRVGLRRPAGGVISCDGEGTGEGSTGDSAKSITCPTAVADASARPRARSTNTSAVAARLLLSLEGTTTPLMFRTWTPCAAFVTVTADR